MSQATGPARPQPATLVEVARLAGVSVATASKALNGRSQVRAETRQRVIGAGEVAVFLCDARGDAIREQHHVRALLGRRVDGLIVVGSRTDPRRSLGRELPVPVVYAYAPSQDPEDLSIVPDN